MLKHIFFVLFFRSFHDVLMPCTSQNPLDLVCFGIKRGWEVGQPHFFTTVHLDHWGSWTTVYTCTTTREFVPASASHHCNFQSEAWLQPFTRSFHFKTCKPAWKDISPSLQVCCWSKAKTCFTLSFAALLCSLFLFMCTFFDNFGIHICASCPRPSFWRRGVPTSG